MAFFSVVFAVTQFFLGESANSQVLLGLKFPYYDFHVACDHKGQPFFLCVFEKYIFLLL